MLFQRSLLVNRIATHEGIAIIAAPGGFGKSTLIKQILHHLGNDPADQPGSESVVVVDEPAIDLDQLDLETLARRHRLVILATRRTGLVGPPVNDNLATPGPVLSLTEHDLRFGSAEISDLLRSAEYPVDEGEAEVIETLTGGWPRHIGALVDRILSKPNARVTPAKLASAPELTHPVVDAALAELDPDDGYIVEQLAQLPDFCTNVAEALGGPEAMERIRSAGVPMLGISAGCWRFVPVVEQVARRRHQLAPASAQLLAPALVASRGVVAATKGLLAAGVEREAAELLADAAGAELDDFNQHELLGLLSLLEPQADDQPRLHLHRARALGHLARLQEQSDALANALRIGVDRGEIDVELEAQMELLYNRAMASGGDMPNLVRELSDIERRAPRTNRSVRTRIMELRAMAGSQDADPGRVVGSERLFLQAAAEWEHLNEVGRAARCLRILAATTYTHLGNYTAAGRVLDRCQALVRNRPWDLALTTELQCRVDALRRDPIQFTERVRMARALARTTEVRWLDAYLSWSSMHIAAHNCDVDEMHHSYSQARMQLGELLDDKTGVVFLAESASLFAELGCLAEASDLLREAAERAEPDDVEFAIAEVTVAARSGDHESATALMARVVRSRLIPPDRLWRVWLEVGLAAEHDRRPDDDRPTSGKDLLERAVEQAAVVGLDRVAESLIANHRRRLLSTRPPAIRIQVLGKFQVHLEGTEAELPPGHVSTLVKLLAANGEPVPIDVVLDILWPNVEVDVAKRRLKNVVVRTRRILGPGAFERNAASIKLGDDVEVDLMAFDRAARAALEAAQSRDGATVRLTLKALELYGGHLIPVDLYDDWIERQRQVQRSRAALLLDHLLARADETVASPAWLLELCRRVEPGDLNAYVTVGSYALKCGEQAVASEAAEQAKQVFRSLGIPQTSQLSALETDLIETGRHSSGGSGADGAQ